MAQIPVPNGGQVVAAPAQTGSVPRMDVSGGINSLADQAGSIANDIINRQYSAKATLALATATNAVHDAHDAVMQSVTTGQIDPKYASARLQDMLSTIDVDNTKDLPNEQAQAVRAQLIGTNGAVMRQLNGSIFKYQTAQAAGTLDETGRQLQQQAAQLGPGIVSDTYDAILNFTGSAAGFTPEQIEAKKRTFRQSTTAQYYELKGTTLHAAEDLPGVTDTLHDVLGAAGDQMTPQQKDHVVTHLVGLQNQLLAAGRRDANAVKTAQIAKENDGADAYNHARSVIVNGQYLSADAIADLTARTTDTKMAMPARNLLTMQEAGVNFASAPADQRAATLERYRAEAANPAVGTSADGRQQLQFIEAINAKADELAKDDPWKAAQTYGVVKNAPVMDFSDLNSIPSQLDVRMQQIGKVEAWARRKVSPLQPAEAEQLGHTLKGLPVDQAASMLSTVGQMIGDPDRIGAVAKQLGKATGDGAAMSDTFGLAMACAGDRTNGSKLTAELILRGEAALKNKTTLVDNSNQSGWKAQIFDAIDGAFSSQNANDSAMKAAYLIAAANGGDVDAAVKAATGGIITHGLGKIPLPVGVDESTFDKRLAAVTPAMLAPQSADGNAYVAGVPMPLAKFTASLPSATLVHAGQGMYAVKAGTSFVTNKDGQRIVLRISQ